MRRAAVTLATFATLCACGGSSTSVEVVPLSEAGFAEETTTLVRGNSFTIPALQRIVGSDEVLSFDTQDIGVNLLSGTTDIEVIIGGNTYRLPFVEERLFRVEENDDEIQLIILGDRLPFADIVEVFSIVDGDLNTSYFILGFDSDPDVVGARTGTATMNGELFLAARNGFEDAFGTGDVQLIANFDAGTVSGDLLVVNRETENSDFNLPPTSFDLDETEITGNGFSGTITLTGGELGGTLRDATYDGRFFGVDAQSAGGQIAGTIERPDDDLPTLFDGAFLVSE